jgi:uridylate kinase
MAKNGTDGVYTDDPRTNPSAKKYTKMTFDEITNQHLKVMDSTAATLCSENNINIIVFDMNVSGNIAKAISHPEIGTLITK